MSARVEQRNDVARFLGRIVDDEHAVDAGALSPRRANCSHPSPRSDWRSPSARPAFRVRACGTRRRSRCTSRKVDAVPQRALARALYHRVRPPSGRRTARRARSRRRPPATSACISGTAADGVGSPAVMNGISALRCSRAQARANVAADAGHHLELDPRFFGDGVHVLVAAAGEIHEQDLVLRQRAAPSSPRTRAHGSTRARG